MLMRMSPSAAPPSTDPPSPVAAWPTGFMVLHGNRLEDLRQLLIEHVRLFPLEGLSPEWVVVQSNGMKQWLEQGLAGPQGLGICAATRMLFPAEMLWQAYRMVLGPGLVPPYMPLDREHLVWRLMRLLPDVLARDAPGVFDALTGYVRGTGGRPDDARLLQLCQQLASLYDGYQNYRADWLRLWAGNADQISDAQGLKQDLPPGERWQACLWRELLSDVATTQQAAVDLPPSRAEVHQAFLRHMEHHQPAGLPKRILVFGVSAMPMQSIEALAALGRVSQVMVFVLNPCRYHWGHVVSERQMLQAVTRTRQKLKDVTPSAPADTVDLHTQAQPLLAAWGQQGRDYLHLLDVHDDTGQYRHLLERIDLFEDPLQGLTTQATRLQQLQSDILNLNPIPATRHQAAPGDDSFVLVKAHSAVREVELLHDRILAWLQADPDLRPREIIVMVPDMSRFAPLIHAVWGRFAPDDPRRIAYSVADQSAKDHPMAAIVEALLQGPSARLTLDDWLSWLEVPAFARACGFPAEELYAVRDILKDIGVRWGLDGAHRISTGVALSEADATPNTWLFGLQRLLLAQAQGPQSGSPWQGVWPADVQSPISDAALNALCASLQTLSQVLHQMTTPRTPGQWVHDLHDMIASVLMAQTETEQRTLLALGAPLNTWLASCQVANLDAPVSLTVVRSHWMSALSDTGSGNRFLSGGVQFATLMPMRSIPFKRVCLLGMNDGQYPRRQPVTDFDLMRAPGMRRPGDRSRREDDRFLFLEALLGARQQVYISWQGWQTTDQSKMYPSVLVGQLIDHLNATHTEPVQVHSAPMQSFSRQYFESEQSPWRTYAIDWALARGWSGPQAGRQTPRPGSAAAAVLQPPQVVRLGALAGMLRQPLDVFYVQRLGMGIQSPEEELPDAEPFDLGQLDMYGLVQTALTHADPERWVAMARASGLLPLGPMALRPLKRLDAQVQALSDRRDEMLQTALWQPLNEQTLIWHDPLAADGQTPLEVTGTIGGTGWYTGANGQVMQIVLRPGALTKSKVPQAYPLLSAWSGHVLANACGMPCTTHWIGLGEAKTLAPLEADRARAVLQRWLAAYRSAWAEPIALPGRTALVWLASVLAPAKETDPVKRRKKAHADARSHFMGSQHNPREAERLSVAMMRRHAREYSEVMPLIETWAPVMYRDLIDALMPASNGSDAPPGGGLDD